MPEDLTPRLEGGGPRTADPDAPVPVVASLPEAPAAISWRRPLFFALLVIIAGAALGAAAFAGEQHYFVWEPEVSSTPEGSWRVAGSPGLRPTSPAFAGDRLVWGQGPYTCVLELETGDSHVVGVAPRGSSIWPPATGPGYVTWAETPRSAEEGVLWVYDAVHGRRQRFTVSSDAATPAVSGDVVAWYDVAAGGTARVEALDMGTGLRSVLKEGPGIEPPVLGGDGAIGWVVGAGTGGAPRVVVHDLATRTETIVPLAGDGSGLSVGDIRLGGRTLLWTLTSPAGTRVVVFDLDTHATSVVVSGAVAAPATDGKVVVWAAGEGAAGSCVVRSRALAGGPTYEVGRPAAWPSSTAVGSGWVAWAVSEGDRTYLEAVRSAP